MKNLAQSVISTLTSGWTVNRFMMKRFEVFEKRLPWLTERPDVFSRKPPKETFSLRKVSHSSLIRDSPLTGPLRRRVTTMAMTGERSFRGSENMMRLRLKMWELGFHVRFVIIFRKFRR